jgi:Leucine-rich repeat (LRR) protein
VARNTNAAVEPRPSKRALDAVQQTGGWQTYRSSWACLSALTRLTELPAEIGNLTSLRSLFLGDNQLTELPPEIGNLTSLKSLSLYRNQLTELPPEIGDLAGLERLWVGNNRLTAISQNMVKLEKLNQGRSSIKVFGEFVSSGRIVCRLGRPLRRTPKGLDLSHNLLTILPPEINQLREEWGIDLSGNPLMS